MSTALKIGVIIGYIAIISFIATYLGKGTKTFKDFAIGGSKIPWYIMGGTLFSTFCGGATMVAYVGNFYSQGLIWIWIPVSSSSRVLYWYMPLREQKPPVSFASIAVLLYRAADRSV